MENNKNIRPLAGIDYCNRAKNKNPNYTVPDSHKSRLAFQRELFSRSQERNVIRSDEAILARSHTSRKKRFYPDREKAMRALFSVFMEHVNVVTHQVPISLRQAADETGLSTISEAEKQKAKDNPAYKPQCSISRASRAFHDLIDLGFIVAPKVWQVWDKEAGQWLDKYFEITEAGFAALGITPERVRKQRDSRLKYLERNSQLSQLGLTVKELGQMCITEIKQIARLAHYRRVFERRKRAQKAAKARRELCGRSREEQRTVAAERVISKLGRHVVNSMGISMFKEEVNKELGQMRRLADVSPPS
ncbi:plasmid replication initiator RepA [Pseudoalteromonas ruthenica]|uniref:plasmid replication initiator RepA n=1 Tax=Pseudoalteromonas ruthenica TaxID=151081 RepID=UPI001486EBCF|nr:plasmid replication initiator RepA [Pseudoalteromonas ruthenica]